MINATTPTTRRGLLGMMAIIPLSLANRSSGVGAGRQTARKLPTQQGTALGGAGDGGTVEQAIVSISVEEMGAVSLPTGTDSTAAIRAALDRASLTGATVVGIPGKQYAIAGAGVGAWPAGVKIRNLWMKRSGTVSAPAILIQSAGIFTADGLIIEEAADHSSQNGSIVVDHALAEWLFDNCRATKGYSGLWVKQCARGTGNNCDFSYSSHPVYFGRNDVTGLGASYGYVDNVVLNDCNGHHAKTGGDGLKTVSRTRNLNVVGGEYYANDQDGIDLFAGCMKARFSGVKIYDNRLQGFDIKVGDSANGLPNYPEADWGERHDITIYGCFFNRNGYNAIKVFGDDINGYYKRVTVTNCQIDLCGGHGIVMRGIDCTISKNIIRRCGQASGTAELAGISIHYDTPVRSGLKITDNVVIDCGRAGSAGSAGMLFTNCSFADIAGNTTGNRDTANQQISYFFNGGVFNRLDRCSHVGSVPGQVIGLQANNVIFGLRCGLPIRSITATATAVNFRVTTDIRGLSNPYPFVISMTS